MEEAVFSEFLFARPSFVAGAARTIDLFALLDRYNKSTDGLAADRRAIAADWAAVWQDYEAAMREELLRLQREDPEVFERLIAA